MNEQELYGMKIDIYNRCSTREETQTRALEIQAKESRELVMELGGIIVHQFVESESGTTTKAREQYRMLMEDVQTRQIDCVVIKSIDRLMRNAGDWHLFVNQIMQHNIRLYIYMERKFYEPEDAFLAGIKALMAEQYSRELSMKVNNAHRRRQITGRSLILTSLVYGYTKQENRYEINEDEAYYIREMFNLSVQGLGVRKIADRLYEQGFRSKSGKKVAPASIRRIIRNPMYCGTVIMNRKHYDFEQKRTYQNNREKWYIHDGRIPAIVSKNVWKQANAEMDSRRENDKLPEGKDSTNQKYLLSGKLVCGQCKNCFYPRYYVSQDGQRLRKWCCGRLLSEGNRKSVGDTEMGCSNIYVYEKDLWQILKAWYDGQNPDYEHLYSMCIQKIMEILRTCSAGEDTSVNVLLKNKMERLQQNKKTLLLKLAGKIISDEDYQMVAADLDGQESVLQKKLQQNRSSIKEQEEKKRRVNEILRDPVVSEKVFCRFLVKQFDFIQIYADGILHLYRHQEKIAILSYSHETAGKKRKLQIQKQVEAELKAVGEDGMEFTQLQEKLHMKEAALQKILSKLRRQGNIYYRSYGRKGGRWYTYKRDESETQKVDAGE